MSSHFINLTPESIVYHDSQNNIPAETTRPAHKTHAKQWKPIIDNLLDRKLPLDEKTWDAFVDSPEAVASILKLVTINSVPIQQRAVMTWEQLFCKCGEYFSALQATETGQKCKQYFRLAVIALSIVASAVKGNSRDAVFDWLRECLASEPGAKKKVEDESLRKLVKAVKNGVVFIDSFTDILGQRANELPFHVASWTTVFYNYTYESSAYLEQNKTRVYRPMRSLEESRCLSLINVVYLIAGGRYRAEISDKQVRDLFLPQNGTLNTSRVSTAVQNFFPLRWQETLDRKQEASSDVLSEVLIAAPWRRGGEQEAERTQGLYSYGLPSSCRDYLDLCLTEKSDELVAFAKRLQMDIRDLRTLEREPDTICSEVGTVLWTPQQYIAVILPLSDKAVDVNLVERATGATEHRVWEPAQIIYLEDTRGLAVIRERIHLVYAVVRTKSME